MHFVVNLSFASWLFENAKFDRRRYKCPTFALLRHWDSINGSYGQYYAGFANVVLDPVEFKHLILVVCNLRSDGRLDNTTYSMEFN